MDLGSGAFFVSLVFVFQSPSFMLFGRALFVLYPYLSTTFTRIACREYEVLILIKQLFNSFWPHFGHHLYYCEFCPYAVTGNLSGCLH